MAVDVMSTPLHALPLGGTLMTETGLKRFARGVGGVARRSDGRASEPKGSDINRLLPLRGWWDRRTRGEVSSDESTLFGIAVQVADATEFAANESHADWAAYNLMESSFAWSRTDIRDIDGALDAASAAGIDTDAAWRLLTAANLVWFEWRQSRFPTDAARRATHLKHLWAENILRAGEPAGATMLGWLGAAWWDVPWDVVPCTWSNEQVPVSSAMVHVASRVIGRRVRRSYLSYLYGHPGIGSSAFALQMVATAFRCGLGGRGYCHGDEGSPCPLVATCAAYSGGRFPLSL